MWTKDEATQPPAPVQNAPWVAGSSVNNWGQLSEEPQSLTTANVLKHEEQHKANEALVEQQMQEVKTVVETPTETVAEVLHQPWRHRSNKRKPTLSNRNGSKAHQHLHRQLRSNRLRYLYNLSRRPSSHRLPNHQSRLGLSLRIRIRRRQRRSVSAKSRRLKRKGRKLVDRLSWRRNALCVQRRRRQPLYSMKKSSSRHPGAADLSHWIPHCEFLVCEG